MKSFSECKINNVPSKNKGEKIARNLSFIVKGNQIDHIKAKNIETLNECIQDIIKFQN